MFRGKKYQDAAKQIEKNTQYDAAEGFGLICKTASAKFDETVELHVKLGVDSRHADQQVRGAIVLPNGTGKTARVLVFAKGDKADAAREAGADYVGEMDMVEKIQKENWFDFDVVVASPDMMGVVGRLGKVLGPKGLMPSPKAGTVTPDVAKAVKDVKADPDVLPHEEKILTLGSYGRLSFFQFKGAIEALLRELNIKGASFAPEKANPSYHPGRCAKVLIDGKEIGVFGTIHPTVAARYGLSGEVLAAELRMDALLAAIDPEKLYHPLPKFPASTRDIAVLVDDAVPAASMQAAVEKAAGKLLESVKLFDVYKGKGIPDGKKSVAYSLSMRAPDRTLTDEECDKAMRAAISALETEFGAQLRG